MINIGNKKGKVDITWSDVESSSIEFIHYHNDGDKGMLGVTFKSGDSYVYSDVGINEIISIFQSDSVGAAFSKNIRMNYSYKNIGDAQGQSPLRKIGLL
jgi:hypothetical protein